LLQREKIIWGSIFPKYGAGLVIRE
jgi:hypothetical protein